MYARLTTIDGEADRFDEGTAFVREEVAPLLESQPGFRGMAMWSDRGTGQALVASIWADRAALESSEAVVAPRRSEGGKRLGGEPRVEIFALKQVHRVKPVHPGCWARAVRISVPPAGLDDAAEGFRLAAARRRELPGFRAALLFADPASGDGLAMFAFDGRSALEESREPHARLREEMMRRIGGRVTDVHEYEVTIAGLVALNQYEESFRKVYASMSAGGDLSELDKYIAADIIEHEVLPPGIPPGLAGVKALIQGYRAAFPDLRMSMERYVEQGDVASSAFRVTGTHTGEFMGIAPTGRTIDVSGMDMVRFVDGMAVEHWGGTDTLTLFGQLGVSALPEQRTSTETLRPETITPTT